MNRFFPCRGRALRAAALLSLCSFFMALSGPRPAAAQQVPVSLELVLAVDASSSVSGEEFNLQMEGLARAFRDPSVGRAIEGTGSQGIAVALVQWSDNRKQIVAVDWRQIRSAAEAQAFAAEIEGAPRYLVGGGTAIGGALEFSIRQLEINGFRGQREVIDVSGDGRTNQGPQPAALRDLAVSRGITINGLAILNEDPVIDGYYARNVIGGPGAFVMTANDYAAYGRAILSKLVREIEAVPIAGQPAPGGPTLAAAGAPEPPGE